MKTNCYLIIDRSGPVRITKRAPDLTRGQIAVRLQIEVPDAVFAPPDIPDAALIIGEEFMLKPEASVHLLPTVASDEKR